MAASEASSASLAASWGAWLSGPASWGGVAPASTSGRPPSTATLPVSPASPASFGNRLPTSNAGPHATRERNGRSVRENFRGFMGTFRVRT